MKSTEFVKEYHNDITAKINTEYTKDDFITIISRKGALKILSILGDWERRREVSKRTKIVSRQIDRIISEMLSAGIISRKENESGFSLYKRNIDKIRIEYDYSKNDYVIEFLKWEKDYWFIIKMVE